MTAPIRLVIVEDQALLRGSLRLLFEVEEDMTVAGEAGDGRTALEIVRREKPDIVLMDIRLPELDGIEATRRISADPTLSDTRVLVLTTFDDDENVYGALRAGASGFLLKDAPPPELLNAIRAIAVGDALLAPRVTRRLIADFLARPIPQVDVDAVLRDLTSREREVLEAVALGLSNQEIGDHLHISQATVKTHIGHLLQKLRARDRAQLVIAAYETGLVQARSSR